MKFIDYEFNLGSDDAVEVRLDRQAYVRLLDGSNFERYRTGQPYTFYGSLVTVSPFMLWAPHAGHWHVVIDLGGYAGTVNAWALVV